MQDVVISREKLVIPTYAHAPAEKTPMFYELRNNQGTRGNVYPYPMIDKLSDELADKEYDSVRIENEYVRVVVLPELGGRIYEGYDKIGGYNFVYKNNVIKPALIGLLGAWVSGGIEFNWPQHHRPTTFLPVDVTIEEGADGSKTAWMGEIELLSGTKGMVGIALYPGKSFIQAKARIYNRTPQVQTFHWWANLAVHTNDNYQLKFPPDIDYITTHYKPSLSTFPKLTGEYMGQDYGAGGPDVSWYKNVTNSSSFFIFNSNYSFMGGYDHGKQRGTVHVADRHVSPGKKFFSWGVGDFGKAWQKNLTDADGPYLEIMTGCYTDNQPDFAFLQPYETKTFEQHWFGLCDAPDLVNASVDGAISLAVDNCGAGTVAKFSINSTSERIGARARLLVKDDVLFAEDIDVAPGKPWKSEIRISGIADPEHVGCGDAQPATYIDPCDVRAEFLDAGGSLILAYQKRPMFFDGKDAPKAHPAGRKPCDIGTIEELYLEGLQIEQYRHPTWTPEPYYMEALRRDPGDARCNNAMGARFLRLGEFGKAVKYFERAVKRLTMRNPNPYDGEPFYNLGVALRLRAMASPPPAASADPMPSLRAAPFAAKQSIPTPAAASTVPATDGRWGGILPPDCAPPADILDAFKKAAWSYAWRAPALEQCATLYMRAGDWAAALRDAREAYKTNTQSLHLRMVMSAAFRKLGAFDEAKQICADTIALDKLDYAARYELHLLTPDAGALDELDNIIGGRVNAWLAIAGDYIAMGLYDEAAGILERCTESPMKYYYLAYASAMNGAPVDGAGGKMPPLQGACYVTSTEYLDLADAANPDYCFPSTNMDLTVLLYAARNHSGALAPYLLGLIYYARGNADAAIGHFEDAVRRAEAPAASPSLS